MIAFVDESLRMTGSGLYVVAAVVITSDPDRARRVATSSLLPGQLRWHWREENEGRRRAMLARMAGLGAPVYGYVRRPVSPRKQERARALIFERMLWDLKELGAEELVIESRHESSDKRDRQTIIRAQKSGAASQGLVYGFEVPSAEPLLWLADAAAGALSAHVANEADYLVHLPDDQVSIVELAP